MGVSRSVVEKAAKQGGYISRDQLLELGMSPGSIDRTVHDGDLAVVAHGTYRVFTSNEYTDLLRGAVLTLPDAVISHQSAAHLLDFPIVPALEPSVTVPDHTTHKFPGVTVHRSHDLDRKHLTTVHRLAVTNVLRTAFDLAAVLEDGEFEAIVEALLLNDRMKMRHFIAITAELARRGKPGSRLAKDFIALREGTDPRATAIETRGRSILTAAGLPPPIPQYPIPWDTSKRFDDAYPPVRLALEWDSLKWHGQRPALRRDRVRDREAAVHGWFVARFTWEDVTQHPDDVAATVAALLEKRRAS